MRRQHLWRSLVLLVILTLIAGCGAGTAQQSGDKGGSAAGGETRKKITFAQAADITATEPYNGTSTTTATVLFQIFNSLTRTDEEGNVVGDLAESFAAIDDVTWQFKLRQGVAFSNGEPFNAEAVKFSVDRMLNAENAFKMTPDFAIIKEAVVVDDYTVNIVTKEPFQGLPLRLFYLTIVPPKYIEEVGNEGFAKQPVGTGPYKFVEYVKDDHVTLEANESYYKGKPSFDEIVFRPIPEEAARIAALQAGEVDLISGISTNQLAQLQSLDGVQLYTGPTTRAVYISLNTLQEGILQNKQFRQGLNYAVDVDSIVNHILQGHGNKLATVFLPHFFGYTEEVTPYPYDVEKAKELIQVSGYKGEPLNLTVTNTANNTKEVAEAVAAQLKQAGVNVNVVQKESAVHTSELEAGTAGPLWVQSFGGPYNSAELISRASFGKGQRYSAFDNKELDELREKASATLDERAASELWKSYQAKFKEEAPAIFLYQQYASYAYNDKLADWKPRMDELILFP